MKPPQMMPPPANQLQEIAGAFDNMDDSTKLSLLLGEMMKINAAVKQCQQDVASLKAAIPLQRPWTPSATPRGGRERPTSSGWSPETQKV